MLLEPGQVLSILPSMTHPFVPIPTHQGLEAVALSAMYYPKHAHLDTLLVMHAA